MEESNYPVLRKHTNKPAPYGAGPTPQRSDKRAQKLAQRISHFESTTKGGTKNGAGHEQHKPGSFK